MKEIDVVLSEPIMLYEVKKLLVPLCCSLLLGAWPFRRLQLNDRKKQEDPQPDIQLSSDDYLDWGLRLASLERYDRAEEKFRQSMEMDPDNVLALYNLGLALELQQRSSEAIQCYQRAYELYPESEQILTNYGLLLLNTGDHEAAVEKLEAVVQTSPDDPEAHYNLGIVYFAKRDIMRAASSFQHAAMLAPDDPEVHFNLALALLKCDQIEQAKSEFGEFISLSDSQYPDQRAYAESVVNSEISQQKMLV